MLFIEAPREIETIEVTEFDLAECQEWKFECSDSEPASREITEQDRAQIEREFGALGLVADVGRSLEDDDGDEDDDSEIGFDDFDDDDDPDDDDDLDDDFDDFDDDDDEEDEDDL